MQNSLLVASLFTAGLFMGDLTLQAQVKPYILTRYNDGGRSGANLNETVLTTANVNSNSFGRLFLLPVDDQVYAGLLYFPGLPMTGGTHNVLYAATMNNTVYAFDADSLGTGAPLWQRNFNGTGRPTTNEDVGGSCANYQDFRGNIGIVGTPVINPTTKTMYFVTRTVESGGTVQRLRAIDITTGADRTGSPATIGATVAGNGEGGSTISFNSLTQNQRPALAFAKNTVYISWASFCDTQPYHGWVMGYDSASLAQVGVYNTSANGGLSGIWMAGAAPMFDNAGNVYVSTGNGSWNGRANLGESLIKLQSRTLKLMDFFTASNYNSLNGSDMDFGSGGPTAVPGTKYLVTGGKEGKLYLLDATNLGKIAAGDAQIPQVFQAVNTTARPSSTHHIHNANPWWQSPQGLNVYVWGENDYARAYRFDTTAQRLVTTAAVVGPVLPPVGMPGGMMSISAKGSQAGTGILWATLPRYGDANQTIVGGELYALNAETLALLWSSTGPNEDYFAFSKGSNQIIANGKVYVAGVSKYIGVYGLKSSGVVAQNKAYLKTATGSTSCNGTETPDKAVNGTWSGGNGDKWCSQATNPTLTIDLGSVTTVSRVVIEHAGAGGETFDFDTADFTIQLSTDGANYTTAATVTGNVVCITTHDIAPVSARYVRLNITKPAANGDGSARIYEVQVF
ncbi:MAG: discoidin domain-containing protein [Bryobacteraceae bacterium]